MQIDLSATIIAAKENKTLNKPFRTPKGPKKFSVYVKNEKGNIVKVNFGDPNMEIKRDDPDRRRNFRARHNCSNPGPKTKARYWSCKMWEAKKSVSDYIKGSTNPWLTSEWNGATYVDHNELLRINPELAFIEEEINDPDEDECGCHGCGCERNAYYPDFDKTSEAFDWSPPPLEEVWDFYDMTLEEYSEIMDLEEIIAARPGPKSAAQTPANPSEKRKGSSKNKPGSAGSKGGKINFSENTITSLKEKVKKHNAKYSKKVTIEQLKKVYRRGAGAFSSSHRPGMSRGGWAMARVNMFLKMKRGGKVKDSYRKADGDI